MPSAIAQDRSALEPADAASPDCQQRLLESLPAGLSPARQIAIRRGLEIIARHRAKAVVKLQAEPLRDDRDVRTLQLVEQSCKMRLPHPIPYQGSKRNLAPLIGQYIPRQIATWYEPFAGSAAMTLWAASKGIAGRYILADALEPITDLWRAIIAKPDMTADRYERIWCGQSTGVASYFNSIRERYNKSNDPVDLLYLTCRCVKNAIRFNRYGKFTQSVDKRRLGMRPDKMRAAILGAAAVLHARTEVRTGDWVKTTADAGTVDFVYLDPPYLGTTIGRDKRYAEQLARDRLIQGLALFRERRLRLALSYDGMTGAKEYGPPLPNELGLTRLLLHAGISSQSTLVGRREITVESLYLSPDLLQGGPAVPWLAPVQESLAI